MTDYTELTDEEIKELSDSELREAYDEVVDTGVERGSRGMSFGMDVVMSGSAIKKEAKRRGMDL